MLNSKAVKEGAIFSVISLILIFLSFVILPLAFVIPIPFIIYTFRYGLKPGMIMTILTMLLLTLFTSAVGFVIVLLVGSIGLTMGSLYRRGDALTAVVGGLIVAIADFILVLVISKYIAGIDIIEQMKQAFLTSLSSSESMLNTIGGAEQAKQAIDAYKNLINSIDQILPFIIISLSLFVVFADHFITVTITKGMGQVIPKFPPFRDWVLPRSVVFYFFISIFILMVKPLDENFALHLVAININPLLQILLIFQGVSFAFFYAHHKNLSLALPILAIIASFLPIISEFVIAIGMMDIGFKLRNRLKA